MRNVENYQLKAVDYYGSVDTDEEKRDITGRCQKVELGESQIFGKI